MAFQLAWLHETVMLMVAVRPESSFPGMRRRPPPI